MYQLKRYDQDYVNSDKKLFTYTDTSNNHSMVLYVYEETGGSVNDPPIGYQLSAYKDTNDITHVVILGAYTNHKVRLNKFDNNLNAYVQEEWKTMTFNNTCTYVINPYKNSTSKTEVIDYWMYELFDSSQVDNLKIYQKFGDRIREFNLEQVVHIYDSFEDMLKNYIELSGKLSFRNNYSEVYFNNGLIIALAVNAYRLANNS